MSNVHITEKMSTSNKPQEKQGPNFMALLTVSKKSARTEAGILRLRQARTQSYKAFYAYTTSAEILCLLCKRKMLTVSAEFGG